MKTIPQLLAEELGCKEEYVNNVVSLLDEGNTIPFIARYRKEAHGAMDDTTLRTLETRLGYLRNLQTRREEVKASIDAQGKLTDELSAVIDRALTLAENIERLGIAPAAVTNLDTGVLANDCAGMFDLTVVDAPCSGEGMFRKNPDAPAMWSTDNVAICAARQSKILSDAAQTVAVGGYLLYSTCTFSVEENEDRVVDFLENFPDFEPVYPDAAICGITDKGISNGKYDMSFCRRAYPHISGGEGQFAALFLRVSGPQSDKKRNIRNINAEKPDKSEEKLIRAFLCETIGDTLAAELAVFGRKDGFYIVDGLACLPSKGVLSPGVKLGEIRKGRVVPHHRFFMAYGKHFINKFEMDRRQAEAYIRGDTVACDRFCGYGAAVFCGCTLGAVKVSDGVAKNHYPKGLRIR